MGLPGECQFHLDGVLLGLSQMNISLGVKAWFFQQLGEILEIKISHF